MRIVTSANVACGWHAGDEGTMRETVRLAVLHGVAIGAHPSVPDREGFGRSAMIRSPGDIYADVAAQLSALGAIAGEQGVTLRHVKPHGALYNAAATDEHTALAICRAVRDTRCRRIRVRPRRKRAGSGRPRVRIARGRRDLCRPALCRRRHAPSAMFPAAVIDDAAKRSRKCCPCSQRGIGETVCVHGDTPGAVDFARAVREGLIAPALTSRSNLA